MSDTNRVQLAIVAETTLGAQRTGVPLQIIRYTGESLKYDMGTATSNEIRQDRQVTGIRKMSGGMSGDINFELSFGSYDTLFQMLLQAAAWSTPVSVSAATISGSAVDNSFNDSGGGLGGFDQYEWIYVDGTPGRANDRFWKIESVTANKIVVSGGTVETFSAAKTIAITQGGYIETGVTQTSINIEKLWQDLTEILSVFLGSTVDKMSLTIPTEGFITGSFSFLGVNEMPLTETGGSEYTAVNSNQPFADLDLQNLYEDGDAAEITEFTITAVNNLRKKPRSGTPNPIGIGAGEIAATGTLVKYFTDATLYNKMLNETQSSIAVALIDPDGNGYVLDLPALKYTAGDRPATGKNADVFLTLNWGAYRHPTEGVSMRLARFPALAQSSASSSASASVSASASSSVSSSPSSSASPSS